MEPVHHFNALLKLFSTKGSSNIPHTVMAIAEQDKLSLQGLICAAERPDREKPPFLRRKKLKGQNSVIRGHTQANTLAAQLVTLKESESLGSPPATSPLPCALAPLTI